MAKMTDTKIEILPPPSERFTIIGWLVKNFLSPWYNALLSLIVVRFLFVLFEGGLTWAFTDARWAVVPNNMRLYLVGQYPSAIEGQIDYIWRLGLCVYLLSAVIGFTWGVYAKRNEPVGFVLLGIPIVLAVIPVLYAVFSTIENAPKTNEAFVTALQILGIDLIALTAFWLGKWRGARLQRYALMLWILYFPVMLFIINGVGEEFEVFDAPLAVIPTRFWGGLLLSLILAVSGIVFSFPIGVILALGRQSRLPIIRSFSIIYIEFIRGVPLISLLFMGQVMLNLFIPGDVTLDRVIRAMVPITLFSAAYLAENVRGGLQSIPQGQYEAAHAVGLNGFQTMTFIILPQALRAVIPVMVGQFISLFKDTTLVSIVGMVDLMGISKGVLANPSYVGTQREVYLFISVFYFVFSYALSYTSRRLETVLGVGER